MVNIRTCCTQWAKRTFSEELESIKELNPKVKSEAKTCFDSLNLSDKCINGYACERLPKTEEGRVGLTKTYSELFYKTIHDSNFSPVAYLIKIIENGVECDLSKERMTGAVARGLRTLTSFLREPDFATLLKSNLKIIDPAVSTKLNPKQDSGEHTDVLLNYKNQVFRLWLYQFSSRGLPHDIDRILGRRGELPAGFHVLCPLHTEVALNYDKKRKAIEALEIKLAKAQSDLVNSSERAVKKRELLSLKIDSYRLKITQQKIAITDDYNLCKNELDIVEGWFFYSEAHVERIARFLNTQPKVDSYNDVINLLKGPERYLLTANIFEK